MTRALILDFGGVVTRTPFETHDQTERALGLAARDCVFVDDQPRNVEGARAIGLPAVQFDVADPVASYDRALRMPGVKEEIRT